jgi:general stress protein CsbA
MSVPTWNNYFHLLANWKHSKYLFIRSFSLENIMKEVYSSRGELNTLKVFHLSRWSNLKWQLSFIDQLSTFQKLHLLKCSNLKKLLSSISHWVHLKILICVNASTYKNYLHVHWLIKCNPKVLVVGMYELVGITYIYNLMHSRNLTC